MTTLLDQHTPSTGFDCGTCGEPWPCAPAKVLLSEEFEGQTPTLMLYLCGRVFDALSEAVRDSRWGKVDDLYERFLGWVSQGGTDAT